MILEVKDFNLAETLECGQCFRWDRNEDGSYTGVITPKNREAKAVKLIQHDADGSLAGVSGAGCSCAGTLEVLGLEEEDRDYIIDYLDLARDYSAIKDTLSCDAVVKNCIKSGAGIHIMNQDNWETLISFIISQNNNIPRIKKCIDFLCQLYGEELGVFDGLMRQGFPSAAMLARLKEEDLAPIRLGYRAPYIIETAKQVMADDMEKLYSLDKMPYDEAFVYLTSLKGVGPKVANCILLFAGGHREAFPVDVWVARAMNRLYGIEESDRKAMKRYADEHFGELGGYAQQYLFYALREEN